VKTEIKTENSQASPSKVPVHIEIATEASPTDLLITAEKSTEKTPISMDFSYLGKNQKNILILVNDDTNKVSTENGVLLLRNIVKAIGLQGDDFALVNYSQYPDANFQQLHQFFKCKLMLAFGVSNLQLSLEDMPLHQLFKYQETQMVFTHNLAVLDGENEVKKIFWKSLQQIKHG
jgi:DNA polymerase III psi subunit